MNLPELHHSLMHPLQGLMSAMVSHSTGLKKVPIADVRKHQLQLSILAEVTVKKNNYFELTKYFSHQSGM